MKHLKAFYLATYNNMDIFSDDPFVSVQDALACYKKEVLSTETQKKFLRCLESFNFKSDDNIIPMLYMIVRDPQSFKDPQKFPHKWKSDSSKAGGVSAINKCAEISIIKNAIGKDQVNLIRTALSKYISELQGSKGKHEDPEKPEGNHHAEYEDTPEDYSEHSPEHPHELSPEDAPEDTPQDIRQETNHEKYLIIIEQLKKENMILQFKNEKLMKLLAVFVTGETKDIQKEWLALTVDLFNMVT